MTPTRSIRVYQTALDMAVLTACIFALMFIVCQSDARVAKLVKLDEAVQEGAVCLDGTPPGYYIDTTPLKRWIIHLEGGGWCYNEDDCYERSFTNLGSSTKWPLQLELEGFLSNDSDANPVFANYSVVFIPYCDGASFSGNKTDPITIKGRNLYFRGHGVLSAVIDALLDKEGLKEAEAVILTGCSAGGLATYLHLDYVRSRFPNSDVHGIADAGYFIDAANTKGQMYIRSQYQYVYHMQNCSGVVNNDCVMSKMESDRWQCFMAQYTYPYIKTPVFVLNSEYDTWQLDNILQLGCLPPHCNETQMKAFTNWRGTFLAALEPAVESTANGLFTDSCLYHCQSLENRSWSEIKVGGQNAHDTFSAWYLKGPGKGKEIDGEYPNNPTCNA